MWEFYGDLQNILAMRNWTNVLNKIIIFNKNEYFYGINYKIIYIFSLFAYYFVYGKQIIKKITVYITYCDYCIFNTNVG